MRVQTTLRKPSFVDIVDGCRRHGAEQAARDKPHIEQASAAEWTTRKTSRIPLERDTTKSAENSTRKTRIEKLNFCDRPPNNQEQGKVSSHLPWRRAAAGRLQIGHQRKSRSESLVLRNRGLKCGGQLTSKSRGLRRRVADSPRSNLEVNCPHIQCGRLIEVTWPQHYV